MFSHSFLALPSLQVDRMGVMFPLRFPCLQVDWMSDMFDGLLLQADDASDAGSVDNDSDLEVVEAEVNVVPINTVPCLTLRSRSGG